MGELKKWREQNWVRIGVDGSIKGPCGTSKDKKIQTAAYQWLKPRVSLRLKERLQLARKKLEQEKENNL
jgi:hypothetical protein